VRPGGPNKPYVVLGQSYTPQTGDPVVHERGLASWYGAKFHGRRTASGEVYNMYAMTAAHRTLPIPSYARVRNPANGREVIVRINDRGPFHRERVIDLSYTAALKLGVLRGVAPVELERLTFEQIRTGSWRRDGDPGGLALTVAQAPVPTAMPAPVAVPAPADVQAPAAAEPAWTAAQTAPAAPTSPPASLPLLAPQATEPLAEPLAPSRPAPEGWGPRERAAADEPTPIAPRPALATPAAVDDRPPDRGRAYTNAAEGWWLQLGAFRRLDGAEALRQKVARDHAALAPLLTVFNEASLFRLQAGPYASRSQARLAATRLGETLADAPVIVERR
jgi:rare lipoprotein A